MLARSLRILLLALFVAAWAAAYATLGAVYPAMAHGMRGFMAIALAALVVVLSTGMTIAATAGFARSPAPWADWWRSVLGETVATVVLYALHQAWARKPPAVRLPPSNSALQRLPVVLVHGYLCNHRIWDHMAQALLSRGHAVLAIDLEPVFGSIDDYAQQIEQAVRSLMQATGAPQVALVGHSMGGLAIRAWMRTCGTASVAGVITLGTPHQGTRLARMATSPNGRQMRYQSPWLQALAQSETDKHRALVRMAITTQDNIVYPQAEQLLPGCEVTVFHGIGHLQLCTDAAVQQWVLAQLLALEKGASP